ncbi:MFS transporter [Maricaulis sp. D1M11]|uniref:MFS transporter n=1 Tax=Maricaulis sp. D1M11 TaxID=3076117 RepID=UPI0039B593F2
MQSRRIEINATYGAAHYGKSLFWYSTEFLFGFYLGEVYGLPAQTIGSLLAIFLLWDALTDPIVGLLVFRGRIRTRNLTRLQLVGALLSAVTFIAIFYQPPLGSTDLFYYALACGLLFRTSYTLYDVPQNALLGRLAQDGKHRLSLAAIRGALSAVATLTISLSSAIILSQAHTTGIAGGFTLAAAAFSSIAITSALVLHWRSDRLSDAPDPVNRPTVSLRMLTLTDRNLLQVTGAGFLLAIGWPLFGKIIPFYASLVMGTPAHAGTMILVIGLAALISQPVWTVIGHRTHRSTLLAYQLATTILGALMFGLAAATQIIAFPAIFLLSSGCNGLGMLCWTRLADVLYARALNDVLAFGLLTFASKIGLSLSGLLLGGALSLAGYRPGDTLTGDGQSVLVLAMVAAPILSSVGASALLIRRRSDLPRSCDEQ